MKRAPANIVGIDLGNSSLKAVRLQKKGSQYVLARIANLPNDRNPQDQTLPLESAITVQIKAILNLVKASGTDFHFTVNSLNSTVRYVELPNLPLDDVRAALKLNSATYLRQSFENYTFDACPLDAEAMSSLNATPSKKSLAASAGHGKIKVLASGISTPEVILYFHAARNAGASPRSLQLVPISLLNAFEAAFPEIFSAQPVTLLDMGHFSSSLTIVDHGKPLLTRMVQVGGKHIIEYVAAKLSIKFAEAAARIQQDPNLSDAVAQTCVPLVREVRSSINFFEKNSDQAIGNVFLSGGLMRFQSVVEALSNDVGLACEVWNAASNLPIELPPDQQAFFAGNQAMFTAAIGLARTYAHHATTPSAPSPDATLPATAPEATPPSSAQ